jgi:hypothetical protein
MIKTTSLSLILTIVIIASSGIQAVASEIEAHEDAVIKTFACGDYVRLEEALEKMLTEHPLDPVAALHYDALFQMSDLFGHERIEEAALRIKEAAGKSRDAHAGARLLQLQCGMERLLYRFDSARAKKITDELKPVRIWTLFGPYRRHGAGDLEYPFEPELISSGRDMPAQKRIRVADYAGWLDPGKYLFPDNGVVYAAASFNVGAPVKIRIYSRSVYKAFINGREAVRNDQGRERNMRIIRVSNARGVTLLLKLTGAPFEKIRIVITDEKDSVLEPDILSDASFADECVVSEELDFPHAQLSANDGGDPRNAARLGLYFDNLESKEASAFYRKAIAREKSDVTSYMLAMSLIRRNRGDRGSAGYNEGWSILNELGDRNPALVPARQKKMEYMIDSRDYLKAYREGKRLVSAAPRYPFAGAALLRLLNSLGYEKEFEETASIARKHFPQSIFILDEEAEYYKKRDRGKFLNISIEILSRSFTVQRARSIAREYISRGEYQQALDLIKKYNYNNDLTADLLEIHIRKKDIKAARELVFKSLLVSESPYLYYALGLIDIIQSEDPSMYLQKLVSLNPSLFAMADYLQYLGSGSVDNPFSRFMDAAGGIDSSWFKKEYALFPSTVLYRGRTFLLQKDGSSRVFCEDIIHVGNDAGVRRWGDIRIPYRGELRPVHLRVYDGKGGAADSYTLHKIQDDMYVNINSLQKNSIIHLSYIVDNPITTPAGSSLFSLPVEYLQHYDEPVNRVSIRVIAPPGMKVRFLFKAGVPVVRTSFEGLQLYTATIDGIPPVKKEPNSGGRLNCLHYYSFSTMEGFDDFAAWYNGLRAGRDGPLASPADAFKKDTIEETVTAVYNFIARDIELQRAVLFYPEYAENTFFRKRGTPEDKVILARAMLNSLGIKSYIAFARNRNLPDTDGYVYHDYFTHVLLYVPLEINNALWLDFSNRFDRCGVTADSVAGSNALVLVNNSYRIQKVVSRDERSTAGRYRISLREDGSAECDTEVSFIDSSGRIRSYFSNPLYLEESVHRYFSGIIPGLSIDSFRAENQKNCDAPFILAANGTAVGLSVSDSKRLMFQPVLHKSSLYGYIRVPQRAHPLIIEKPIAEHETYRYTIPAAFSGDEVSRSHELKSRFGHCRVVIAKKGGSPVLEVEKSVQVNSMAIKPSEYNEFLNFCLELKRIEYEIVILRK